MKFFFSKNSNSEHDWKPLKGNDFPGSQIAADGSDVPWPGRVSLASIDSSIHVAGSPYRRGSTRRLACCILKRMGKGEAAWCYKKIFDPSKKS